jgi:hypothetical protein
MIARLCRTITTVWVSVVAVNCALVFSQSPSVPVEAKPAATSPPISAVAPAVDERFKQQHELIMKLVNKHGYKLGDGEPFKYIKDPQNEERNALHRLMRSSVGMGKFMPDRGEETFELFRHVLHALPDGRIASSSVSQGVITLADVLNDVLKLKPYEFDCAPNLLLTYMPGDWVLLAESGKRSITTDAGAAALERILNEQCDLAVHVAWKMIERPAITIRGTYTPKPAGGRYHDKTTEALADGMFRIEARRAVSYHPAMMDGGFEDFLEAIGYLLMMPVVNEAKTAPTKRFITWNEVGKSIEGSERLPKEHEERVLQSLNEQLGYEFSIEPREVRVLSIQPEE